MTGIESSAIEERRETSSSSPTLLVRIREALKTAAPLARFAVGFFVLWLCFWWLFRKFPYLSSGGEIVYRSKLEQEFHGRIFPTSGNDQKLLIFGNSKVLAGFIPKYFDKLASDNGLHVTSFNSGYPARVVFVPQLRRLIERGQIPDVLLLTETWRGSEQKTGPFGFFSDDHEIADNLFPFRFLIRDSASFLATSRQHGGPLRFYSEARANVTGMLNERGYYFIAEQSRFKGDRLPADFHLPTDRPGEITSRTADFSSPEMAELNRLITAHHVSCYFVPYYVRTGERASPPSPDASFANLLESHSTCRVLGPNYFIYPDDFFSDPTHLNREGARVYTQAIYELTADKLRQKQ